MKVAAFVVNGRADGLVGVRARGFARQLGGEISTHIAYRGPSNGRTARDFLAWLRATRPDLVLVFDVGVAGAVVSLVYGRLRRVPVIVDTGDVVWALLRATGQRGRLTCDLVRAYERQILRSATTVTVRAASLCEYLQECGISRVEFLAEGVDTELFRPLEVSALRARLGLADALTVGVVGSLGWNPRFRWCYGMELIEAMARLEGVPIKGLIVGEGPGFPHLLTRAKVLGVADRIVLAGWVPHEDLPPLINCMDICLSTQTNDLVGRVRMTAKLPLYLACGRFVIATRVGDAPRILPDEMLLEYRGAFDFDYPDRLAERLRQLFSVRADAEKMGLRNVQVAKTHFEYSILSDRLRVLFERLWAAPRGA